MTMLLIVFFGLLGLGIIVFIHEAGHFIAAKLCGVTVEIFSLGWGKKMVGFKHKGTTYQIAWFPIGGYCKMKGEMQAPTQIDDVSFDKIFHEPGTYMAATWWKKVLISVAGPLFNLIFAILIFTLTGLIGYNVLSEENKIILAEMGRETPAMVAGLETGDRIIKVEDQEISIFRDLDEIIRKNPEKPLEMLVERNDRILEITIIPELQQLIGWIGVAGWNDPVITRIEKDSPAALSGLQIGDRIVSFNNQPVENDLDIVFALKERPVKVQIVLIRNGVEIKKELILAYNEKGETKLGMSFLKTYHTSRISLGTALVRGVEQSFEIIELTIKGFGLLFSSSKEELKDATAGPIRIIQIVGEITIFGLKLSLSDGIITFFRLICMLCVIVAIMNLLPIPALDGGQIVLSIYIALRKEKISMKFIYRYQLVGFFIVILLLTITIFSDIFNVIG